MCLAIPARVEAVEPGDFAVVAIENVRKRISTALLDGVSPGDFVLVHVGYALHRLSEKEAQETLHLMAEAGVLEEELDEMSLGAG